VIVAHILGIPVEEGVLQLASVGATVVTAVAIVCRTQLTGLRDSIVRRRRTAVRPAQNDRGV
jgi:hypothetical protein